MIGLKRSHFDQEYVSYIQRPPKHKAPKDASGAPTCGGKIEGLEVQTR